MDVDATHALQSIADAIEKHVGRERYEHMQARFVCAALTGLVASGRDDHERAVAVGTMAFQSWMRSRSAADRDDVRDLQSEIESMKRPCGYCSRTADDMLGHDHCLGCVLDELEAVAVAIKGEIDNTVDVDDERASGGSIQCSAELSIDLYDRLKKALAKIPTEETP